MMVCLSYFLLLDNFPSPVCHCFSFQMLSSNEMWSVEAEDQGRQYICPLQSYLTDKGVDI